MHSWRVLLLQFLSEEEQAAYKQYDFKEPWDGPNNRKLANKISKGFFHCPSGPNHGDSPMTDYVIIVGSKTAFPGTQSTTFDDFRDGRENTILFVEIANSNIHWMEPRDLNFDEMSFVVNDPKKPSISSPHPRGPAAVFADGIRAYPLGGSLRPQTLRALTTIAGGEPIFKERLIRVSPENGQFLAE